MCWGGGLHGDLSSWASSADSESFVGRLSGAAGDAAFPPPRPGNTEAEPPFPAGWWPGTLPCSCPPAAHGDLKQGLAAWLFFLGCCGAGGCAWFILSISFEVHQIKGSKITDVDEVGLDSDGICVSERGPGELPAARGELSVLKAGQGTKDKNCQVRILGTRLGMLPPLQSPPSRCPGAAQQAPVPHAMKQLGLAGHTEPARAVTTMGETPQSPWADPWQGCSASSWFVVGCVRASPTHESPLVQGRALGGPD